jgi:rhodanese-related sulfurtransferase
MFVPVKPRQAEELIASGSVEVVDVREVAEWQRGHIAGARPVTLAELRADQGGNLLPRDGVLFVCAGGVRSQTAARIAVELGLKRVYSLVGGTQSWGKAGLPLVTELSVAV